MINLTLKELNEGTFGPFGLDIEMDRSSLKEWLNTAQNLLQELSDWLESKHTPRFLDARMGYLPYALGDISNFLQQCEESLDKHNKKC